MAASGGIFSHPLGKGAIWNSRSCQQSSPSRTRPFLKGVHKLFQTRKYGCPRGIFSHPLGKGAIWNDNFLKFMHAIIRDGQMHNRSCQQSSPPRTKSFWKGIHKLCWICKYGCPWRHTFSPFGMTNIRTDNYLEWKYCQQSSPCLFLGIPNYFLPREEKDRNL